MNDKSQTFVWVLVVIVLIGLLLITNGVRFTEQKQCDSYLISYETAKDMFKNRLDYNGIKEVRCDYHKDNNIICSMIPQKC